MMRLIDADELLAKWDSLSERGRTEFDQVIMNQPTAYDTEKVVAELTKQAFCRFENCENCHTCEPVIDEKKAKEIVRKGGVE